MTKLRHILPLALTLMLSGCGGKRADADEAPASLTRPLSEIRASGELRFLTLSSSTSYFIYKGEEMGYEFELAESFAHALGLRPVIKVAPNIGKLTEMLAAGEGDLIAYPMPHTIDNGGEAFSYCGDDVITTQVLVQRRERRKPVLNDVTQLVGKEIYVERDTKFAQRLMNLNDELGGGIGIHTIEQDSLTSEDLIRMVAEGKIDYTLADDNVARVNKTFYYNLDISLTVSFPQRSSWMIPSDADSLQMALAEWMNDERRSPEYKGISKRYFELSKMPDSGAENYKPRKGRISDYDALFRKYAPELGWDWRLLAALVYEESRFNPEATSWAGARGLMQLMPHTGTNYGLTKHNFTDPEANLAAGVRYIAALQKSLSQVKDTEERTNFVLASFHSGLGHVYDAIELASKYGYDTGRWDNNVATCLRLKSNPVYYNDSVVKCGYFPGSSTLEHVRKVKERYSKFKKHVKK